MLYDFRDESEGSQITCGVPFWQLKEISDHPSYHGALKGTEAETRLIEHGADNCYLTRYSEERKMYILSVLKTKGDGDEVHLKHFNLRITKEDGHKVYEIYGTEKRFSALSLLLDFYKSNFLSHNIDSIGEEVLNEESLMRSRATMMPEIANGKCSRCPTIMMSM